MTRVTTVMEVIDMTINMAIIQTENIIQLPKLMYQDQAMETMDTMLREFGYKT